MGIKDLSAKQKLILWTVWTCHWKKKLCQPSLPTLASWCKCGRRTIMRALVGLDGRHGWIKIEWRGGRKANLYAPGRRLLALVERSEGKRT